MNCDKYQVHNFSEFQEGVVIEKEEDSVEDELLPFAFVAVSSMSPKREELNDQLSSSCASDPLMPNSCEEDSLNGVTTDIINVNKERENVSDVQVKVEVHECMLADENNVSISSEECILGDPGGVEAQFESICDVSTSNMNSIYSVECILGDPGGVEAQFESISDVSTSDMRDEELVDPRLYVGDFDGADKKPLVSFGRNQVLSSGAKESSIDQYQQEMNQGLGIKDENHVERKEASVKMEMSSSRNESKDTGNGIKAVKTYGPSKSGIKLELVPQKNMSFRMLEKYQKSFICPQCGGFCSSKIMYNENFISLGMQVCVCPLKNDQQESKPAHHSAMSGFPWNGSFNSSVQLVRNSGTGIKKSLFSCYICSKSFSGKVMLDAHVQTHMGKKLFVCGICEKSFNLESELDTHLRTHAVDNPYKCHLCNCAYSCKSKLAKHMRCHTKRAKRAKRLNCRLCKNLLIAKSAMTAHRQTHGDNMP